MFYQLPNGKVIEISTELYFELGDEELEYLVAYNYGDVMENPWYGSVLNNFRVYIEEQEDYETPLDLTSVTDIEKIIDLDTDFNNMD